MPVRESVPSEPGNGLLLVAFCCANSSAQAGTLSKSAFQVDGATVRLGQLACSRKIEILHLLRALETGADAVALYTCPDEACRFGRGSIRAGKRVQRARRILEQIKLGGQRIFLQALDPANPRALDQALAATAAELAKLGPSPLKTKGMQS